MGVLKNYCRSLNLKTAITVGVIGYPNVGKSSLINSLKRCACLACGRGGGGRRRGDGYHSFLKGPFARCVCLPPGAPFNLSVLPVFCFHGDPDDEIVWLSNGCAHCFYLLAPLLL